MGSKIKYAILIVTAGIEYFTMQTWLVCKDFTDIFHHSSIDLKLQIEDYVHTEKGTSLILTRVFNNKLVDGTLDFLRFYMQFWDVRFGSIWFSIIGFFGILFGFYYFFSVKKKGLFHWLSFAILLLLPLIEIFLEPHVSLIIKAVYLWLPYCLFSLYGIYQFLSHGNFKKRLIIIIIILVVSIWWFSYIPYDMPRYCVR